MKYPYISTKGCAKIGYFPPLWLANSFPEVCGVLGVCSCHRFRICYKTFTFCSLLTRCKIPCACCAKRHLNVQTRSAPVSFLHLWLRNVLRATKACTFSTSQLPKALRTHYFFTLLTSKYFEMCFAPQRCAFFRHLNFQKWSEHGVFWCVLDILTWKCASRHNRVHFFDISTSKRGPNMVCFVHFDLEMRFAPQRRATSLITWLHTRRFREPTYFSTLQSHKKLEKHSVSRLSYLFARLHLLSSESFSFSDSSHLCFFHLSILSEVWLLNFLRLNCD